MQKDLNYKSNLIIKDYLININKLNIFNNIFKIDYNNIRDNKNLIDFFKDKLIENIKILKEFNKYITSSKFSNNKYLLKFNKNNILKEFTIIINIRVKELYYSYTYIIEY